MNLENKEALIEDYINDKLDPATKKAFEQAIKQDKDLAKQVSIHHSLQEAFRIKHILQDTQRKDASFDINSIQASSTFGEVYELDRENIIHDLRKIEKELGLDIATPAKQAKIPQTKVAKETTKPITNTPRSSGRIRRLWPAAAAAAMLLVVTAWFLIPRNNSTLVGNTFVAYEDKISKEIDKGLAMDGFAANKEQLEILKTGMDAYAKKDYQTTIINLQNYIDNYSNKGLIETESVEFYLALALLADEKESQVDQSILLLEDLNKSETFDWKLDLQWFLALAYIADKTDEHTQSAKNILKELRNKEVYSTKAKQLLDKLPQDK
ncbi:MAG: hypothetical protein MK212_10480 [Saprospiraceae bacterium]|nr:hypothetical protein [Saprospiraceae bacterium]